jgi:glycosyltransferase involved in cell wall biosynthesis
MGSCDEISRAAPRVDTENEHARISVIVPAFNAGRYLAECLESIIAQDLPGLEVIVVDDGSTDDTRTVCAKYEPQIRYVWQPNSGGCSAPRNHGARLAVGEFLAFFDADDVMCFGRLRAQLEVLQSDPELGLALTNYRNFDESGDHTHSHFSTCAGLLEATALNDKCESIRLAPVTSNWLLVRENFGSAGSTLFRRTSFEQAGGFDETLSASEDFDLIYRVARRQPIALLGRVGFRRRLHATNMSHQTQHILACKIDSRRRLLATETQPELRQALRRSIAKFELTLSRALIDGGGAGAGVAYMRALSLDPVTSLRHWRVFARVIPPAFWLRLKARKNS